MAPKIATTTRDGNNSAERRPSKPFKADSSARTFDGAPFDCFAVDKSFVFIEFTQLKTDTVVRLIKQIRQTAAVFFTCRVHPRFRSMARQHLIPRK
jgi:hypothetical protein